jgi:rhamnose transport system ATP-binding protein
VTAGDGPRGIPPDDRPAPPGAPGASPAGAQEHSPQEAAAGAQGADQAGAAAGPPDGSAARASEPYPVPTVTLRHVAKAFGAVRAVIDGTIDLHAGEAHALIGENGAGKSTMVKILAGVHEPDEGEVLLDGHPVTLASPAAARDAGIAVIYQEPTLFPDLSVAENIFMGRQPLVAGRRIDRRRMLAAAAALFGRLGVRLDPGRICRGLSIADQQLVEIAKALSLEARVIVMDEPTAALSATEVARLFEVVRTLRAGGSAVLFISHRLEEVFEICQRVTVMRDGRHVLTSELGGMTTDDLVRAMVGRPVAERTAGERSAPGDMILTVERLTREGVFIDVSLQVRAGEIVALAGLVGSGRSEVARAVFGVDRYDAGRVVVRDRELRRASPTAAMAAGIGFVPEDRRQQGLVMDMSVQQNVALASLGRLRKGGLVRSAAERAFASDWAVRLNLKYGRLTDPVLQLSGGNQQKVVLAKWLGRSPALLIVDEPTRGIDIATKAEVHRLLVQLAAEGVAILVISSELPEVLHIGDRILVMREGRLTAELRHDDATEEKIMAAATGQLQEQGS